MQKKLVRPLQTWLLVILMTAAACFFTMPWPGTIPVLMYHFVGTKENALKWGNFVSVETFEKQMAFLSKFGYRVISIDEYYETLNGRRKPEGREIVITFDDGDWSFEKNAAPFLIRHNFPATQFLISEKIKGNSSESIPLSFIKQLQKESRVNFHSHTASHASLPLISPAKLNSELTDSKQDLEQMLGTPVSYLTYPFGDFNQETLEAAQKAGYKLAFTTGHKKLNGIPEGPFSLTRVTISEDSANPLVFWYHVSGISKIIKGTREKIRNQFRRAEARKS